MAIEWKTVDVPLAEGLDTKSDDQAAPTSKLSRCENGEFTDPGGIHKRNGSTELGIGTYYLDDASAVITGTLADARELAVRDDELVLFTKNQVYSYIENSDQWSLRGDYDAVSTVETTISDSIATKSAADRAELGDVIVYAWVEGIDATNNALFVQASDKVTGAVIHTKQFAQQGAQPRLIALTNKIMMIFGDTDTAGRLNGLALDPDDIITSIEATPTPISSVYNGLFDAVKTSATTFAVVYPHTNGTSYTISDVTESFGTTTTNHVRACDGPVALAMDYVGGVIITVGRFVATGTVVKVDNLNYPALTDLSVDITLDSGGALLTTQIAMCYKDTTDGGFYRCYVFWSIPPANWPLITEYSVNHFTKSNWVDTNGATGTQALFRGRAIVSTRAFLWNGYVYTTLGRLSSVQASHFVIRHDGLIVAKMLTHIGGVYTADSDLPNVTSIGDNDFAVALMHRQKAGKPWWGVGDELYTAAGVSDVIISFDSRIARNAVQVGRALYMPGGMLSMYDGESVVESGFHDWPEAVAITNTAGSIPAGKYTYRVYWEWTNAQGERELGTYTELTVGTSNGSEKFSLEIPTLTLTAKQGDRRDVVLAIYRTEVDPGIDAPFYRVSDSDITSSIYVENDPTVGLVSLADTISDANLVDNELDYQNSGEISNVGPGSPSVISAGSFRLFTAGYYDKNLVRYSKIKFDGEAVTHNDTLNIVLPQELEVQSGDVTAIISTSQALVIFKEKTIYIVPGDGQNNLGVGEYAPAQRLYSDVGCSNGRLVVQLPTGVVFFSAKGFYLLDTGYNAEYIGGPVEQYNDRTFVSATVVEDKHQVRFLATTGESLVYDYFMGEWSLSTLAGNSAVNHKGSYYHLIDDDPPVILKESTGFVDRNIDYAMTIQTNWIKLSGFLGYSRLRRIAILGHVYSAHRLQVRLAYDYEDEFVDTFIFDNETVGPMRHRMRASRQKVSAVRVEMTDLKLNGEPRLEAYAVTGLSLEVGVQPGIQRLPAAQTS